MSFQPIIHSLHLWYYPPHVKDVSSNFEMVAYGYADRLDTLNPTKGFKRMLDKLDNRRDDEGTFIFSIYSGHCSQHIFRWMQGQEGKVCRSKYAWPIKQSRAATTLRWKSFTPLVSKTAICMGPGNESC